ncbi:hypothetical protein EP7_000093 [Isosphaeraceae bacterium EP7]
MRKALFALMLLGASFAGGAAINGPAFEVARTWLMGRTRSLVILTSGQPTPAEAAPADPGLNSDAVSEAEPDSILTPAYRKMGLPGRKSPALARKGQAPAPDAEAPKLPTAGLPTVADPTAPEPLDPKALSLSSPPAGPDTAPPPDFGPPIQAAGSLLADLTAPAPAPAPPALPVDPAVAPAAVAPAVQAPNPLSPSGGRAGSRDWSELRRKLRAAGVARYELKAEPEGRAHIACLIPLAGRRAVAQQFEAEGADECAAVEAVLRRIALWKATEGGTP